MLRLTVRSQLFRIDRGRLLATSASRTSLTAAGIWPSGRARSRSIRSAAWQPQHQGLPSIVVLRPRACWPQTEQLTSAAWSHVGQMSGLVSVARWLDPSGAAADPALAYRVLVAVDADVLPCAVRPAARTLRGRPRRTRRRRLTYGSWHGRRCRRLAARGAGVDPAVLPQWTAGRCPPAWHPRIVEPIDRRASQTADLPHPAQGSVVWRGCASTDGSRRCRSPCAGLPTRVGAVGAGSSRPHRSVRRHRGYGRVSAAPGHRRARRGHEPVDTGSDRGVDELGDRLGHARPARGQDPRMCDHVVGDRSTHGRGRRDLIIRVAPPGRR